MSSKCLKSECVNRHFEPGENLVGAFSEIVKLQSSRRVVSSSSVNTAIVVVVVVVVVVVDNVIVAAVRRVHGVSDAARLPRSPL